MSLREEIAKYTSPADANVVIEIFQKRIDSEIKDLLSLQVQDKYHVFEIIGYTKALEKVKEMLK